VRGSPIRKSSDQRSVDSSPRLIAASYVLHRLLVPRHPPCALKNLATHKKPTPDNPRRGDQARESSYMLTRCSRPLCSSQSTGSRPTSPTASPTTPTTGAPGGTTGMKPSKKKQSPVPSGPNSVPTTSHPLPPRSKPSPTRTQDQQVVLAATPGHRPN
jgi:hypothetical protein